MRLIARLTLLLGLLSLLPAAVAAQGYSGDPNYKGGFGFVAGMMFGGTWEATISDSTAVLDLDNNYSFGIFFDLPVTDQILVGPRIDFIGVKLKKISGENVETQDIKDSTKTQTMLNLSLSAKYAFRPEQAGWAIRPGITAGFGFLAAVKTEENRVSREVLSKSNYFSMSVAVEGVFYLAERAGLLGEIRYWPVFIGSDDFADLKATKGTLMVRAGLVF